MFPWITVAARLDGQWSSTTRIFVTLPLYICIDHTRVNGVVALSRDRRSLWTDNDAQGTTSMNEVNWNNFLFRSLLLRAWQELLIELRCHQSPFFTGLCGTTCDEPGADS